MDLILMKIIFNCFNFYSINWSHVFFESPTILSPDPGTPRYFTVGTRLHHRWRRGAESRRHVSDGLIVVVAAAALTYRPPDAPVQTRCPLETEEATSLAKIWPLSNCRSRAAIDGDRPVEEEEVQEGRTLPVFLLQRQ